MCVIVCLFFTHNYSYGEQRGKRKGRVEKKEAIRCPGMEKQLNARKGRLKGDGGQASQSTQKV
jgi:hypothetical protein